MIRLNQSVYADILNRSFVSKNTTGTQVMLGSLNILGSLTVGSLTSGAMTINGAVSLGSNNLTTTGTITAGTFSGRGASLTNLNASNISSGTIADARLSSNVMLLNNSQTVSGGKTFTTEQKFHRGTWTDPHVGTNYAIKWAQGAAGDTLRLTGDATVLGNVKTANLYLNISANEGNIYGVDTIEGYNDLRFSIQGQGVKHVMNATGLQLGGGTATPNATLDVRGDAIITGYLDVQTEAKFTAYNEFPDPLMVNGLGLWASGLKGTGVTTTFDAAQSPKGTGAAGSLKIVTDGTATDGYQYYEYKFDVNPNDWITFSSYLFATTTGANVDLFIVWFDSNNTLIRGDSVTVSSAPTSWTRYKITAQAPANASTFKVRVDVNTANKTVYFSAFQVERGRTMTGFSPYSGGKDISITYNGTEGVLKSNKILLDGTTSRFTGNVGIGIDPSYPLHIKTSNTGTALYVENGSTNGTIAEFKAAGDNTLLTIQSDHVYSSTNLHLGSDATQTYIRGTKIGIRTTSPDASYDVTVNGNTKVSGNIDATGNANITGSLYVNKGNTSGSGIFLSDDGSIVDNNDGYATMRFSKGIRITNGKDANPVEIQLANSAGGNIYFNTSGYFGIGTASPSKKFHVSGGESYFQSSSGLGIVQIHGTGDGYAGGTMLWIRNDSTDTGNKYIRLGADANGTEIEFLNIRYGGSNMATIANPSGGGIDITARVSATSFKVFSGFGDLVNNAPWYGLGYSNVAGDGGGYYTQLAGFFGILLKTGANELKITKTTGNVTINNNRILTTADTGPGKGLDADTIDGKHRQDFMSSAVYREKLIVPTGGYPAKTEITIPNGRSYVVGSNRLYVYRDGILQEPVEDYTETSSTSVTFQYALPEGTRITFVIYHAG